MSQTTIKYLYSMARCFLYPVVFLLSFNLAAQDSSKLILSGYAEVYYHYDFNKPGSNERPWFLYNHKRHNEFNINLAVLKAAYSDKKVRANIALMAGGYAQYNLAAEPTVLQHVLEANAGYAFSDKWSVEAGILPSHIGIESAISKDCWNLGRSLLAENSPYYETGIKLNYTPNTKWSTSFLILNGWQNIKETNAGKAIGTQIQYKPNARWLLNSSTFIGNEKPDTLAKQVRFFHNFYATYTVTPKWNIAVLFDIGIEEGNVWHGEALLLQYNAGNKLRFGMRAEQYTDKMGIIITSPIPGGFKVRGLSLNTDFLPHKNIAFRTECRYLHAATKLFEKGGLGKQNNFSILSSIAVSF